MRSSPEAPRRTAAVRPRFDLGHILHLRYTARDGGEALKSKAGDGRPLSRLVSLRHEFPSELHRFMGAMGAGPYSITVEVAQGRFPYFVQPRRITITKATVLVRTKTGDTNTHRHRARPNGAGDHF
jgi:hypothetical protein